MLKDIPQKIDIQEAAARIAPFVHHTPVLTSTYLNQISGVQIFFKPENLQKIGAFKARGGTNAILSLTKEELKNGVVTHSSGNHAQAIAYAAQMNGVKAYIVMPENAPRVKVAAVEAYGGEIVFCENNLEAREAGVQRIIQQYGATFIHPFDHYDVIAGQATAAKELLEDVELDYLIAPVGGGGLLAGTCLAAKYFSEGVQVYAAEPAGAADTKLSFQKGTIQKANYIQTIADGLLTTIGNKNFSIIKEHIEDVLLVSDEEIVGAMRYLWERMKLVVEPSGAVSLAGLLKNKELFVGKKVGVILSGGNVDLAKLPF
jgi:threonine dehydratase